MRSNLSRVSEVVIASLLNLTLAAEVVRIFLDEHLKREGKALLTSLGKDNVEVKVTRY